MKYIYLLLIGILISCNCYSQTYTIDSTFGNHNNGWMTLKSVDSTNGLFKNYLFSKSGKIAALHAPIETNLTSYHGLIQFSENGNSHDATFGNNGFTYCPFDSLNVISPNYNIGYCNALLSNGNILVGGNRKSTSTPNYYYSSLVSFTKEGVIDSSFGTNGIAYFGFLNYINDYSRIEKILQQNDQRIILAIQQNSWENNLLCAIKANGIIDSTFGKYGVQNYQNFEIPNKRQLYSLPTICPDGKLLAYCTQIDTTTWVYNTSYFIKLKINGTPDSSFGINGKLNFDANAIFKTTWNANTENNVLTVMPNNKILLLCLHINDSSKVMVQFLPNGKVDSSFGTNGIIIFPFQFISSTDIVSNANSILTLKNGKIVVCGNVRNTTTQQSDVSVSLLNTNGTYYTAFATNGEDIIDEGATKNEYANSILSADSNSFYICGNSQNKYYLAIRYSIKNPLSIASNFRSTNDVTVYPNPFINKINLQCSKSLYNATIQLFSLDGRMVYQKHSTSGTSLELFFDNFCTGMYYLKINDGEEKIMMKLVKEQQ